MTLQNIDDANAKTYMGRTISFCASKRSWHMRKFNLVSYLYSANTNTQTM